MSTRLVVHAAKIPEPLQGQDKFDRMLAGNLTYVNACDDKPWEKLPENIPRFEAVPCQACAYIVAKNREAKATGK